MPTLFAATLFLFGVIVSVAAEPLRAEPNQSATKIGQTMTVAAELSNSDTPVTCEYGCEDHREGTEICINRKQHRCGKQGWQPTGQICANPPPVAR